MANPALSVLEELKTIGVFEAPEEVGPAQDDQLEKIRAVVRDVNEALAGLAQSALTLQEAVGSFQSVIEESLADEDDSDEESEEEEDSEESDEENADG